MAKDEKMIFLDSNQSNDSIEASPFSEKKNTQQSPLRKALSPINSNLNQTPNKEIASTGHKCPVLFEPKTPSIVTCAKDKFVTITTPLDKFNAMSSNLKVCNKIPLHNVLQ